jgi:hypothetical protein
MIRLHVLKVNHSRINKNSAPYPKINAHNTASYLAHDHSRISEISARHSSAKTRDSALCVDLKSSRIEEDLAHTRNPYDSSKWKVPTYHRPYLLCYDYLKIPDG